MSCGLESDLAVGAILFALGALGFLTRRNLILMMLSAELMLHGVSLNFVAFGFAHGNADGQAFAVFIIAVAACEAALALALILAMYQRRRNLDVSVWRVLREPPSAPGDGGTAVPLPAGPPDSGQAVRSSHRPAESAPSPEVAAHV
jgi:NADH-quinone oxidoreductase subunit K